MRVDDETLQNAACRLHAHFGSLLDLPEELRNTIASVYYEVHWTKRHEGALPLIAHLPRRTDKGKALDAAMRQFIVRSGQYQLVAILVEAIRAANKETQPNLYAMLTTVALDSLKWGIPNALQKSEMRRSLEKIMRKPLPEVPRLYERIGDHGRIDGLQPAVIEYPDGTKVEARVRVTRGPAPARKKKRSHAGLRFVLRLCLVLVALAAIGVGGTIYSDMNKPSPPEWEVVPLEEMGLPSDYDPFADESE